MAEDFVSIKKNIPLIFMLLFGLAVRAYYLWAISGYPDFLVPVGGGDTELSHMLAQKVARGDILLKEAAYNYSTSPLYIYFLGLFYAVWGDSCWTSRIINVFLGAGSLLLLFLITERLFNRKSISHIAVFGAAIYGPFVFYDTSMYKTTLEVFLIAASLLLLLSALDAAKRFRWFFSGISLGLALLVQPQIAVFITLFVIYFLARSFFITTDLAGEKVRLLISRTGWIGILLAGILFSLSPFLLRNYIAEKRFAVGSNLGGINFYIGNHKGATGGFSAVEGVRANAAGNYYDAKKVAEKDEGRPMSDREVSSYWKKKAFEYIFQNKTEFLRLLREKARLFLSTYEFSEYQYLIRMSRFLAMLPDVFILLPFGMAGLFLSLPKHGKLWPLHILFLSFFASVLITFVTARYRISAVYIIWPFAAYYVVSVYDWIRQKDYPRLAIAALLLAYFIMLGASHPVRQRMEDKLVKAEELRMNACRLEGNILSDMKSGRYVTISQKSAAWIEMARIRYSLYDNEGAARILQRALLDDPQNREIKDIILKLKDL